MSNDAKNVHNNAPVDSIWSHYDWRGVRQHASANVSPSNLSSCGNNVKEPAPSTSNGDSNIWSEGDLEWTDSPEASMHDLANNTRTSLLSDPRPFASGRRDNSNDTASRVRISPNPNNFFNQEMSFLNRFRNYFRPNERHGNNAPGQFTPSNPPSSRLHGQTRQQRSQNTYSTYASPNLESQAVPLPSTRSSFLAIPNENVVNGPSNVHTAPIPAYPTSSRFQEPRSPDCITNGNNSIEDMYVRERVSRSNRHQTLPRGMPPGLWPESQYSSYPWQSQDNSIAGAFDDQIDDAQALRIGWNRFSINQNRHINNGIRAHQPTSVTIQNFAMPQRQINSLYDIDVLPSIDSTPYNFQDSALQNSTVQIGPPYMQNSSMPIGLPNELSIRQPRNPSPAIPVNGQLVSQYRPIRSNMLENFKSYGKNNRRLALREIYGHIVEFSGDQDGSRFIQEKLETANSDEKEQVFQEIMRDSIPLMKDVFGNYVIQKMFEHGNQAQKKLLARQMQGQLFELSTQVYGCRVVQKALEHVLVDQQASLIKELNYADYVMRCVKDQNGNHVIQRAIERVPLEHIKFIIDALIGKTGDLAKHAYGCRVVQRLLERCVEPAKTIIRQELHIAAPGLIADQYGNYVVQHLIQHGNDFDRARMVQAVKARLTFYSRQKYASNVVEQCLRYGTDEQKHEIMLQICSINDRGESDLPWTIGDNYGNYVVQRLLETLNLRDYSFFIKVVRVQLDKARALGFNKQVENVEKKMRKFEFYTGHSADTVSSLPTPPLTAEEMGNAVDSATGMGYGRNESSTQFPRHNIGQGSFK